MMALRRNATHFCPQRSYSLGGENREKNKDIENVGYRRGEVSFTSGKGEGVSTAAKVGSVDCGKKIQVEELK